MYIKVFYKYQVCNDYFIDEYNNLTKEQVQKIEQRYSEKMRNGDFVSLVIIIEKG